ncbi:hypothetical protein CK203_070608 [Vitis vinifera]|uniref:Bet v I/Major latex protein domain-containing protein n=1 Tax=Vitis vinifera TaxID=29760 RepID=A0A438C121_VITVI|nr:hypothetical protein CK203_070608 [Vitis vinifera]
MAQIAKMEAQVEIKSPSNKFYEVLSSKAHLLPKACPTKSRASKWLKVIGRVRALSSSGLTVSVRQC